MYYTLVDSMFDENDMNILAHINPRTIIDNIGSFFIRNIISRLVFIHVSH